MKDVFELGDRVEDTNTKSRGIVIESKDFPPTNGECISRSKVDWCDCRKSLIGDLPQGWICNGNLTALEVCPKCKETEFFIDNLQNEERRCRLCYTHWNKPNK